jgi:hypothetical protein
VEWNFQDLQAFLACGVSFLFRLSCLPALLWRRNSCNRATEAHLAIAQLGSAQAVSLTVEAAGQAGCSSTGE